MSKSREILNGFLSKVDIEGKVVLDIGVQDKPASRLTKGTAKAYYTLDIDPQWKPDIIGDLNKPMTVELVNELAKNPVIDVIFCIEVLEHCWNPTQALQNLHNLLRPGGMLYLSTPFINPHHDIVDYLRYTDEWYQKVLPMYGLEITELHERRATTGLADLQSFYRNEGLKYSKIRQKIKPYTYPIGYYVIAKKI